MEHRLFRDYFVEHFEDQPQEEEEKEQTWGDWFWWLLKWMFIVLGIVLLISGILIGGLFMIGYFVGADYIYPLVSWVCTNSLTYTILTIAPIILEIVGIVLSVTGIGIPIVGVGMFLEILVIVCDFLRKEPGWKWDVALGVFGLIPLAGIGGNIGKVIRLIQKTV